MASSIVNYLLEKNRVFFPVTSGRQRVPTRVRIMNDETFKSAVLDLVKCCSDTNLQRHYVGDGHGDVALAGLGIPPSALTDGTAPGAEALFKRSLHEVKGLVESKVYLANPNSSNAAAARQQATLLEGINCVLNGEPVITAAAVSAATAADDVLLDTSISVNNNKNNNNNPRMSPTLSLRSTGTDDDTKSKKSPALMMAEASLLSQQAALKDADNLDKMILCKRRR